MEAVRRDRVGGIVLCGGKSTRMGRPKLSLPFSGETMLARVVRIIGEVVSPIVVVAAPGQALPELPAGTLVTRDEIEDQGPLGGLAAGMAALRGRAEAVYASSCDVPLLKSEFVRAMLEALGTHELAIPRDGQYHHPLAAVYRTTLEFRVGRLIAEGRLRPLFLVQESDARLVDVSELRAIDPTLSSLRNTNTPEEYRDALLAAGLQSDGCDEPVP
jgi:molybdopterin-guanine dinucleotide biosynthesis protein A